MSLIFTKFYLENYDLIIIFIIFGGCDFPITVTGKCELG